MDTLCVNSHVRIASAMLTAGFHLFPILSCKMKRFIKYSILFAAIIAVLLGCCELMVRNSPNTYTMKKNWMISHSGGIKTLITGNSHSYYGIKPNAIGDSVFNIANVSQGHEYDYFLLTKFEPQIKKNKNLTGSKKRQLVLLGMNLFHFIGINTLRVNHEEW